MLWIRLSNSLILELISMLLIFTISTNPHRMQAENRKINLIFCRVVYNNDMRVIQS